MRNLQRMNPWNLVGAGSAGTVIGYAVEFFLSSRGRPPLVPPYSMSLALVALAIVLLVLGVRLRKQKAKGTGAVNPFQAVRLLALARAGELVGSLFGGLGAGMLLSLVGRSVPASLGTWLPMLTTMLTGAALVVCAIVAERQCRIPPGSNDDDDAEGQGTASTPDQPAYRDAHRHTR